MRTAGQGAMAALGAGVASGAEESGSGKRVGLIGAGWYGKVDLFCLQQVAPVEVVALCDVDSRMLKDAGERVARWSGGGKKPYLFEDYREMLAREEFDIVIVGTPDHWHALPTLAAMEAGADVWVQKPVSVDVREGQVMLETARRLGRVVQVGTQRRGTPHLIDLKEKVFEAGLLGRIGHAEVCCFYGMGRNQVMPVVEVPDFLNWELWTGPAPMRSFRKGVHPKGWRRFEEYGNGIMGDMCIHMLDTVRWLVGLGMVERVSSSGGILVEKRGSGNIPDTQVATFGFEEFDVVWTHRTWGQAPDKEYPWAFFIYGEKGTVKGDLNKWEFIPHGGGEGMRGTALVEREEFPGDGTADGTNPNVAPGIRGLWRDFLSCVETRERPVADIEEGHRSSAACILANLALKLERSLAWDEKAGEVIDDESARELLARVYREGWEHPWRGHK